MNGTVSNEGRVEVRTQCNGEWGTVCSDYWNANDAEVACHQLGYDIDGVIMYKSTKYGRGTGNILLDNLGCDGTEKSLFECQHGGIGTHNCFLMMLVYFAIRVSDCCWYLYVKLRIIQELSTKYNWLRSFYIHDCALAIREILQGTREALQATLQLY